MEKPGKQKTLIGKKEVTLILFYPEGQETSFLPWKKGEKGTQTFMEITRDNALGLVYTGEGVVTEENVRKILMKLTNEGWEPQGEITLEFDGRSEQQKELDSFFQHDPIKVEIGMKLLPLADPGAGAPLMDAVTSVRRDIVRETGYVIPGIKVTDNLNIPMDNYIIYIKETPVATGEIFLDRFLAMGDRELLAQLKGWNTREPVFNQHAVWIEPAERNKAEELNCILMGPLNILITHLKESITSHLRELLGLQDIYRILEHLRETHPIVVEDYLKDKKKLKLLRKILLNLVSERVSIRDIITILETVADYEDQLEKTDFVTEMVRVALARQICWSYLDPEGTIKALNLSREMEDKIQGSIKETKFGFKMVLSLEEVDLILKDLRQTLEDYKFPRVIFCDPSTRLYYRRLIEAAFPNLGILSTAEIAHGIPIEILGEVELPEKVSLTRKDKVELSGGEEGKDKKSGSFWERVKSR